MTDFENIFATLQSSNDVRHEYAHQRQTGKATLTVRCRDDSTALIVRMDDKFLADSGGFGAVDVRIDDQQMRSYRLQESTDNKALGLWRGAAIPLLKDLVGARTIRVAVTPFNESTQVMIFDIAGFDNVVADVRERCSW